jgi:predicted lipoprotein
MNQPSESPGLPTSAVPFFKRPHVLWPLVTVVAVGLLVISGYAAGVHVATIKDEDAIKAEAKSKEFNAATFVDSVWESQVIPAIVEKAVDFPTLVSALKADQQAAIVKYGHSETGAYNFVAKGQGKVIAFDASSSSRTLDVDVEPYDGQKDLSIQIGPIINGFSLRDGPGVITFNSVGNQIEYGKVNRELNTRAAALFKDLDPATLQDKVISFYGTFTLNDVDHILLTPVRLKW